MILLCALFLMGFPGLQGFGALPALRVSKDKHHLVTESGVPFFYLGDTAWELFHRLNREEADLYLENRAAKGFTVIQSVALAELDGLKVPNAYGAVPFQDLEPGKPNESYFQHVDYIVNKAESAGLYIGMLPSWGDKVNQRWGAGPGGFFNPETARAYGEFLGKRYKDKPIIWILGGDRNPEEEKHFAIWRALAEGLGKGDEGKHLMTFHPMGGGNSATWFQKDDWLDFNTFQSGHGAPNIANYKITLSNYHLEPPKPALDSEPRYEDHPINWKPANGWFDDWDVRQAAYWSMLAGACGHTYGNHNIWQFWEPDRKPISSARTPWKEALDHPGAFQMGYMKHLFASRPWQKLVPDESILDGGTGDGAGHLQAARAEDGSFLMVYTPMGEPARVKLNKLSGAQVNVWWFDPRMGTSIGMGQVAREGIRTFEPFSRGRGNDWVLVLDDAARGFGAPAPKKKK